MTKPRLLVYVPQGRNIPASLDSIRAIDRTGFEVSFWFDQSRNQDNADHGYQIGTAKFNGWYDVHAQKLECTRQVAVQLGVDALVTIEDDIIVPRFVLQELYDTDAAIAYGLAVWRNAPHKWSATVSMKWGEHVTAVSDNPEARQAAWGMTFPSLGCGFFCTLIRRPVLEALAFHREPPAAADWSLAQDAEAAGFTQKTNALVVCGHVDGDTVYWPCQDDPGWRKEALNANH